MSPKVSVIMTTYNHEKYIKKSIKSILNQTFKDFELIIVDDGSKDKTRQIIDQFTDSRIIKIYKDNEGTSNAFNDGIAESKGDWIAFMSGDDISNKNRLEVEYQYCQDFDCECVFSLPNLIDEKDNHLDDKKMNVFFQNQPKNKEDMFKKFFYDSNFLCAPSGFIKKSIIIECGCFKPSYLQLQDFELWFQILKKHEIKILCDRLVNYRIHTNNLSNKKKAKKRTNHEIKQIYRELFDDMTWKELYNIFPKMFSYAAKDNTINFEIEKTFLYLSSGNDYCKDVGIERMLRHVNNKQYTQVLKNEYDFYTTDLYKLTR